MGLRLFALKLPLARLELQLLEVAERSRDRALRDFGDCLAVKPHRERFGLEPQAFARGARRRIVGDLGPLAFLAALLGVEAGKIDAGAEALGAPAVARVVREEARIERLEAAAALRTRALGREELAFGGAR